MPTQVRLPRGHNIRSDEDFELDLRIQSTQREPAMAWPTYYCTVTVGPCASCSKWSNSCHETRLVGVAACVKCC